MTTNPKFHSFFEKSAASMKESILHQLKFSLAHDVHSATKRDWWLATSKAVQERIIERMIATQAVHNQQDVRRVYYLSLEFLMGRLFSNSLYNAGIHDETEQALKELGLDMNELRGEEYDMGLGNGGLGRLAACFLDSLATLDYPAVGYGIHYEFGLFRQEFSNGHQIELPDDWMRFGTPWEIVRPEYTQDGRTLRPRRKRLRRQGQLRPALAQHQRSSASPTTSPSPATAPTRSTSSASGNRAPRKKSTSRPSTAAATARPSPRKTQSETVSKVLYPNDKTEAGKELRLIQQYFFVSCSLRDIIRRFRRTNPAWSDFPDKVAIQLNDTHPAIAVVELHAHPPRRKRTFLGRGLGHRHRPSPTPTTPSCPRRSKNGASRSSRKPAAAPPPDHLRDQPRLLETVEAAYPGDAAKKAEHVPHRGRRRPDDPHGQPRRRRQPLRQRRRRPPHRAAQETPLRRLRRLLSRQVQQQDQRHHAPPLAPGLQPAPLPPHHSKIGDGWVKNLDRTPRLEQWADDPAFQADFMAVKHANKVDLADHHQGMRRHGQPDALFDVQIKRLHEYKRQHLNLLHILALYRRILQNPNLDVSPASSSSPPRPRPATTSPSASSRRSTPSAPRSTATRASATSSRSSSCRTTASRSPRASSRPPTSPSRSPPRARKPPAPAT
jgi:starch phosphorylase